MINRVALALFLFITPAFAHGPAAWIQEGNYKNAVGELCCGERDCVELDSNDVKVTPTGYYIISLKESVPFNEATPSQQAPIGGALGVVCGNVFSRPQAQSNRLIDRIAIPWCMACGEKAQWPCFDEVI